MLLLLPLEVKEIILPRLPTKNSGQVFLSELCSHTQPPHQKAIAEKSTLATKPLFSAGNTRDEKDGNARYAKHRSPFQYNLLLV